MLGILLLSHYLVDELMANQWYCCFRQEKDLQVQRVTNQEILPVVNQVSRIEIFAAVFVAEPVVLTVVAFSLLPVAAFVAQLEVVVAVVKPLVEFFAVLLLVVALILLVVFAVALAVFATAAFEVQLVDVLVALATTAVVELVGEQPVFVFLSLAVHPLSSI